MNVLLESMTCYILMWSILHSEKGPGVTFAIFLTFRGGSIFNGEKLTGGSIFNG